MTPRTLIAALLLLGITVAGTAGAADAAEPPPVELDRLLELDLAALVDVRVTLAARVEEPAFRSAAAVYVLERDAILRSGYRRLVDILRLLPGVHVGRGNANQYGVSVRGGMGRFTSTVLVMIDGRHVYTPLYGGVRWETQELPLESIERIELVRGPGGPLWGANAVDGIVHVITRDAAATPEALAGVAVGRGDLRHDFEWRLAGAAEGGFAWRIDGRHLAVDEGRYLPAALSTHGGQRPEGGAAGDGGRGAVIRARADWRDGADRVAVIAGVSASRFNEERVVAGAIRPNVIDHDGAFVSVDWQRRIGAGDELRLRASLDRTGIDDDILVETQSLADLDLQLSRARADHLLTLGAGLRAYRSEAGLPAGVPCVNCFGLYPAVGRNRVTSLFVQDQWSPSAQLTLTAGTKFESSDYARRQWQPTLRASWAPRPDTTWWAAATRPVRAPTRSQRDSAFYNVAPSQAAAFGCRAYVEPVCLFGDPESRAWHVAVLEAGWRRRLAANADVDLALYRARSDERLEGASGATAVGSRTHGGELVLRGRPRRDLRLELQLALHAGDDLRADGTRVPTNLLPKQQAGLRASWDLAPGWAADLHLVRVAAVQRRASGSVPQIDLPAATRSRLRLGWQVARGTELALVGGNLGEPGRGEYVEATKLNTSARSAWLVSIRQAL